MTTERPPRHDLVCGGYYPAGGSTRWGREADEYMDALEAEVGRLRPVEFRYSPEAVESMVAEIARLKAEIAAANAKKEGGVK